MNEIEKLQSERDSLINRFFFMFRPKLKKRVAEIDRQILELNRAKLHSVLFLQLRTQRPAGRRVYQEARNDPASPSFFSSSFDTSSLDSTPVAVDSSTSDTYSGDNGSFSGGGASDSW